MLTYRDSAVVLRTHKLGEADRVLTLLTRENGKVRAVAKGVRRTSSRFGARLEPFSHIDIQLYKGKKLDTVTQVVTKDAFGVKLMSDYPMFTAGQVMLESVEKLISVDREPAPKQYQLLVGALRALTDGTTDGQRPASMVLDSYLLRSLAIAGYSINLNQCAICGSQLVLESGIGWFSASSGGMVCQACRPVGAVRISYSEWKYLVAIFTGDWKSTRGSSASLEQKISELVERFFSQQLDLPVRSLGLIDRRFGSLE